MVTIDFMIKSCRSWLAYVIKCFVATKWRKQARFFKLLYVAILHKKIWNSNVIKLTVITTTVWSFTLIKDNLFGLSANIFGAETANLRKYQKYTVFVWFFPLEHCLCSFSLSLACRRLGVCVVSPWHACSLGFCTRTSAPFCERESTERARARPPRVSQEGKSAEQPVKSFVFLRTYIGNQTRTP